MVKEITPVLFFGYDDRFIPDAPAEPVKHDTSGESVALQSIRRMDFRPQPITDSKQHEADEVDVAEEQDEDPKASPATDPAESSSDGSQTSPPEDPAGPASVEKGPKDLTPPLL